MADGVKGIVTLAGLVVVGYLTPPKDQAARKSRLPLAWCAGLIRVCCWVQQAATGSCRLRRWSLCVAT